MFHVCSDQSLSRSLLHCLVTPFNSRMGGSQAKEADTVTSDVGRRESIVKGAGLSPASPLRQTPSLQSPTSKVDSSGSSGVSEKENQSSSNPPASTDISSTNVNQDANNIQSESKDSPTDMVRPNTFANSMYPHLFVSCYPIFVHNNSTARASTFGIHQCL